jgi:hypothetical protein
VVIRSEERTGSDFPFFHLDLPAGKYFLSIITAGMVGDVGQYTLTVAEDAGARMIDSQFTNLGSSLRLMVTFNEPINLASFTIHDVRINGGLAGAGVLEVMPVRSGEFGQGAIDPRRFLITLVAPGYTAMNVVIGPDIVDQFGNRMDQNQNGIEGELNDSALASYFASYEEFYYEEPATFRSTTRTRLASRYADLAFEEF